MLREQHVQYVCVQESCREIAVIKVNKCAGIKQRADNSVQIDVVYWAGDLFMRGQIWVSSSNSASSSYIRRGSLVWCYSFIITGSETAQANLSMTKQIKLAKQFF